MLVPYTCYRTRLFLDLCRVILLPALVSHAVLKYSRWCPGFLAVLFHSSFIISWALLKGAISKLLRNREARRLGARTIPEVIGKWPGNLDILLKMLRAFKTSYVNDVYLELFEEYRCTTLNSRLLWTDNIITMDHQHMRFVLTTGFHKFWRGWSQKERMETYLGEGIFNRDDEAWKMHRNIARPFFARERISEFTVLEKHVARTLAILSSNEASGLPTEAQDLFSRVSIDAASEFLFGRNLDTLSASHPVPGKTAMGPKGSATTDLWGSFAVAFEAAQINVTSRGRMGYFWPVFELLGDKNAPHMKVIHGWLDPLVKQALEDRSKRKRAGILEPIENQTFLQHLVDRTEDPILIRDQLLNMLLAARDTTACLLTYITYFMSIYPDVANRLRAEVLDHCGPRDPPTYTQTKELKYMRAVINETLRLFPPVPLNMRECRGEPCLLPSSDPTYPTDDDRPFYMPGATTITYLPLLVQRNKALWGADADEFDPERWIDPHRVAKYLANPTIFTPFSAGPRICLGQNYAYNGVSYILIRLLQRFDRFTLAPEVQPEGSLPPPEWEQRRGRQKVERIWPSAALTLYVKGGMWTRFRSAGSL